MEAKRNSSRGIIRCPDLARVKEDEIVAELSNQNVIETRYICVCRDGIQRDTNTIVLKFNTAILPKVLKVGYLKVPVDLHIPNPLQRYKCLSLGTMRGNAQLMTTVRDVKQMNWKHTIPNHAINQ